MSYYDGGSKVLSIGLPFAGLVVALVLGLQDAGLGKIGFWGFGVDVGGLISSGLGWKKFPFGLLSFVSRVPTKV